MGGGGTIIIRSSLAETLSNPLVSGRVPDMFRARMDRVLLKDPGSWDRHESRFMIFCLREALDES